MNLYLPERARVRRQGQMPEILVRHLMDHSGGFEDRVFGQVFERDPSRIRPLDL